MDPIDSSLTDAAISVRAYRGEYGTHRHAHAQVLLGFRGNLQLEVEGRPAFVDPSCGLVIPAGAGHGYLAETPVEVVVLDCDAARATERLRRFALPSRWPSASPAWTAERLLVELLDAPTLQARRRLDLATLAQRVDAELHRDWTVAELASLCRFSPQRFRARFSELTGLSPLAWVRQRRLDAAQRQLRAGLPLDTVALQARRRLDLATLAQRVDAELHRDWTVAELASLCRFSPQRFRARFSELTGLSPLAWVRQRRLDAAQRQLRAGLPLDTVALQVGYASASALCFALRRERGIGARQLRARADPVRASLDI